MTDMSAHVARHLLTLPPGRWYTNDTALAEKQFQGYIEQVGIRTAGFGVGLSVILGLLMSILTIIFCCR